MQPVLQLLPKIVKVDSEKVEDEVVGKLLAGPGAGKRRREEIPAEEDRIRLGRLNRLEQLPLAVTPAMQIRYEQTGGHVSTLRRSC